MMLGMTSTPHLLMMVLAVLAVMRGRVDGAMTCWQDTAGPYYLLTDTAKCWAPEINATFDGQLTACSGGLVYADSDAGCYTTIANINKDAKYKGPPLSCGHDRTDGYHWYLAWKSADNCANGITALMEVLDPAAVEEIAEKTSSGCALVDGDIVVFQDMHDGDQKQVTLEDGRLSILPYANNETWATYSDFDDNSCSASIDFNVPNKPSPPPINLTATFWRLSNGDDAKVSAIFNDNTGNIAPAAQPLNLWVQVN